MKTFLAAGAATLASLALVPAAALAAPAPAFSNHLVVPNKSFGGLALNGSAANAKRVFGAKQCTTGGCSATVNDVSYGVMFFQKSKHSKPFIGEISISLTGAAHSIPAAAEQFRTSSGLGIGSTVTALRAAFPKVSGSVKDGGFQLKGPGESYTSFGVGADGRIGSITMASVHFG